MMNINCYLLHVMFHLKAFELCLAKNCQMTLEFQGLLFRDKIATK